MQLERVKKILYRRADIALRDRIGVVSIREGRFLAVAKSARQNAMARNWLDRFRRIGDKSRRF